MDFLHHPPNTIVVQASLPRTLYRDCQIVCVITVTHKTTTPEVRQQGILFTRAGDAECILHVECSLIVLKGRGILK